MGNAVIAGITAASKPSPVWTVFLELAQLRLNQSMSSMLHGQPLTVDSLCQAALRGDLLAKDIITGVGAHVGRILANHGEFI